jgi:spore coat protein CotH
MRRIIIAIFIFIGTFTIHAQAIFPDNTPLYNDNTVPRINITINPDTLEWLFQQENLESNINFRARFIFDNGEILDTLEDVGFRLRGNTSRFSQKKSFKVSFNAFSKGAKYFGVEKLNLNGEHNDPSVMRAKIGWDILRKWNIAAPRSNHAQVYINNNYYGLYLNVEHIDEEFVKSRFKKNNGNLYKCLYPADLDYLGSNPEDYKLMAGNRRVYQLKTNKTEDDYSDLAKFIDVLNNTPNDDLVCKLDEVFNVYDYLKVVAVDILIGNWDGPIFNKNNFYLYHNISTGKFEYIPYDLDNTFGIDWFGIDWATRDIYNWDQGGSEKRPIYTKIMDNEKLRNQYSNYVRNLVNTLNLDSLNNALTATLNKNLPYIENDTYYTLDYGFNTNDFLNSVSTAFGQHVKAGILPYVQNRITSMNSQVENESSNPIIKYINHRKKSPEIAQITAYVEAQNNPVTVNVNFTLDDINWNNIEMLDDGNHNDGEAGDLIYGAIISNPDVNQEITYQISANDSQGNSRIMPCNAVVIPAAGDTPPLFINEIMASNNSTIANDEGEFSDWIEIFNGADTEVWLGNKYLTDNLDSSNKWQMPEISLAVGGFVLFWADGNPENGDFHTNFKLSKSGEEVGIFAEDLSLIDEMVFGPQTTDISLGREKDGNSDWIYFDKPTPGSTNFPNSIFEKNTTNTFRVYPNPANGEFVSLSRKMNFKIYNILGLEVSTINNYDKINITNYNKGIYIIVSDEGSRQKLIVN